MPAPVSIRQSLLWNFALVIIVLGGGILLTTAFGTRRAVARFTQSIMTRTLDETEQRLHRFFDPVTHELQIARDWGHAGLLDVDDPEAMRRLLVPLLRRTPQISSVLVADERGREQMILRTGEAWSLRQTRRDEWGDRTRWLTWTDGDEAAIESWRTLDYDPRTRPWYTAAVARDAEAEAAGTAGSVAWTTPYVFFTTRDPGITAAATYEPGDGLTHVIGFDVLLNDISAFTTAMRVSEQGGAIVLTDDGRVIGLPRNERYVDADARRASVLKRPDELGWTLATDATNAFATQPLEAATATRFRSAGSWWWGNGRLFSLSPARTLWIGVVVSEADLHGPLASRRAWIIAITLTVLVGAMLRVAVLARRFSEPIEQLMTESDRISHGDLTPGPPVRSHLTEVTALAGAHDQMREGLQSLLKLERDLLVAREIQRATFPSKLPALPGFEIVAWSEPADETGGDTYDVIGLRHNDAGEIEVDPPDGVEQVALLLADATGHGVGPALSVTQIRAMLRMAVRIGSDPVQFFDALNEQLHADLPTGRFITAWLGRLDGATGAMSTFSAGQGPLLHYDATAGTCAIRPTDTMPFGIVTDLQPAVPPPVPLATGDIFAVFSDGIFEAADPDGQQFGVERVQELIITHHAKPAAELLTRLREAVDEFVRGHPADDDRTGIIVKRR
ncbi:MAG: SpoIIE family protein phosphatase [Phycisphaerales bacterium]|nr:SpoIIE family protein phosphatase [Phycisphaerales bacterium]NNM26578.1 SpoIIE family protein phosphatase [Phycisphaerales bacterium]